MSSEPKEFPYPFPLPFEWGRAYERQRDAPPFQLPPHTIHELKMMRLSYTIRTTKQDWQAKIKNPEIRAKWKKEIMDQERKKADEAYEAALAKVKQGKDADWDGTTYTYPDRKRMNDSSTPFLRESMIDYVFEELEEYAKESDGGILSSCADIIYESDTRISEELRLALIAGVTALEDVPDAQKDWHPGSDNKVLDLVHPSLFPVIYGRTRYFNKDKELVVAEPPKDGPYSGAFVSKIAQWMPTDFQLSNGKCKPLGYINNLNPRDNEALYQTISSILEQFVPMFDKTLDCLQRPMLNRTEGSSPVYGPLPEGVVDELQVKGFEEPKPPSSDDEGEGEDEDEYDRWESYTDHDDSGQSVMLNVPQPARPFKIHKHSSAPEYSLAAYPKLQVIVKLANIHLTPENPTYDGGVWHVEGMYDERIVASGIYYYDEENITESHLAFTAPVDEDIPYEQGDHRGVRIVYGLESEEALKQYLNEVETKQGRAIVFPNIYQHKVSSFSLVDATKSGHRKILCFFLVDPKNPIISSSQVPPQQAEWANQGIEGLKSMLGMPALPNEIWSLIIKELDVMGLKEAKEVREKLMHERKFVDNDEDYLFERPFSLCEH